MRMRRAIIIKKVKGVKPVAGHTSFAGLAEDTVVAVVVVAAVVVEKGRAEDHGGREQPQPPPSYPTAYLNASTRITYTHVKWVAPSPCISPFPNAQ